MAKRMTMNVSLPRDLKRWVDSCVDERGFGSTSEFVRHLLRQARDGEGGSAALNKRLAKAEREGPVRRIDEAFWSRVRSSARAGAARPRARRRSA